MHKPVGLYPCHKQGGNQVTVQGAGADREVALCRAESRFSVSAHQCVGFHWTSGSQVVV